MCGYYSNFIPGRQSIMKKYLLIGLLITLFTPAFAVQDSVIVPIYRQLFHDKIDNEQVLLDQMDGKPDGMISLTHKNEINLAITDVMTRQINSLEDSVERNSKIVTNNQKIRYLSYIENLLKKFRYNCRNKEFNPVYTPQLFEAFNRIMAADIDSISMAPEIENATYPIGKILTEIFTENTGLAESRKIVYQKFCALNPGKILQTIEPYMNEPFADALVLKSCEFSPTTVYNIAQAPNSKLGILIHRNTSPLVKTVVELSKTPNALMYFPFLDDLIKGKKTVEGIKKYIGDAETGYDSVGYFKLLVQTEIEYFTRMTSAAKDTPVAMFGPNGLREKLKEKAIQHFVTPINELHDLSNINMRMKATDSL